VKRSSWINFFLVSLLWGVPYLLIRVAVAPGQFSPAFVVFSRVAIGAALLLPYSIKRGTLRPALKKIKWIALYGLIEMVGPWGFISQGETKINSGLAALLIATVAIWATLLNGALGDKTVWHSTRLIGLAVGFVGICSVVGIESLQGKVNVGAIILLLLAAMGYAIAPTMARRKIPEIDGAAVNGLAMFFTAIVYLPFALSDWPNHHVRPNSMYSIVALGIFPTAICFVVFFKLIADIGTARASLVAYVNTGVAVLLGVVVLHEKLTTGILVGLPLIMLGSYYASRKPVIR
jgi:drug/metabolite transporter (DMT)-like permease